MKEINKKYLEEKLENLPETTSPTDLWNKLELQLDFQDQLESKIHLISEIDTPDILWDQLNQRLNKENQSLSKSITFQNYIGYASSLAASVLLFALIYFGFHYKNEEVEITYSQEMALPASIFINNNTEEKNALAFINYTCSLQLEICETTEFKILKNQLDDLTEEIETLNIQLAENTNNPYLIKAQIKVENMRADITKKLITIITS